MSVSSAWSDRPSPRHCGFCGKLEFYEVRLRPHGEADEATREYITLGICGSCGSGLLTTADGKHIRAVDSVGLAALVVELYKTEDDAYVEAISDKLRELTEAPLECPNCHGSIVSVPTPGRSVDEEPVGSLPWTCTKCFTVGIRTSVFENAQAAMALRRLAVGRSKRRDIATVQKAFRRDSQQRINRLHQEQRRLEKQLERVMPNWAGIYGYKPALEYASACHDEIPHRKGEAAPALILGARAYERLPQAHAITVPPEQVHALPTWGIPEALEYGEKLTLPFNPLYIDCSAPPGRNYEHMSQARLNVEIDQQVFPSVTLDAISVGGGLLWQEDGILTVIPFGSGVKVAGSWRHMVVGPVPPPPYASIGALWLADIEEKDDRPYWVHHDEDRGWVVLKRLRTLMPGQHGALQCGLPDTKPETLKHIDAWSWLVLSQVSALLAVLYLMDSEVELVPAPLPRAERREAERKNYRIPLAIAVKRHHVSGSPAVKHGSPSKIDWTHQWEVAGHYKHIAKATDPRVSCRDCKGKGNFDEGKTPCERCNSTGLDPEKVKPCVRRDSRTGVLTCPHGCRRIWTKPFWKGPEDKPMVPKLRVIR